jgi:hypothetical protein
MAQIGEAIELSEGDLVLTFNKTIDLMRQVREMLTDVMPEHPLRHTLGEAERLLRRGIVEQSLTLGFAPLDVPEPAPEPEPPDEPVPPKRRRRTAERPTTGEDGKRAPARGTTGNGKGSGTRRRTAPPDQGSASGGRRKRAS